MRILARNKVKWAALALVLVAAMLALPSAQSLPGGVKAPGGCTCHAITPDDEVVVSLEGLPDSYNYSESYELTLSFEGGPSQPGNINQGGFYLWVSEGVLSSSEATVQVWPNGNEAGHTEAGNDQTSWTITLSLIHI